MEKIRKRIWLCITSALVLLGGCLLTTHYLKWEGPHYFSIQPGCSFNPQISQKIQVLINEIITTVANGSPFSLMHKKSHLVEIGDTISKEVSDFAYWGYVFSSPQLTHSMEKIQGVSVKYAGFVKGTQNKVLREYQENPCFFEQAKEFAQYLHLSEDEIVALLKQCIENSSKNKYAFEKYLDYLITHVNPQSLSQ